MRSRRAKASAAWAAAAGSIECGVGAKDFSPLHCSLSQPVYLDWSPIMATSLRKEIAKQASSLSFFFAMLFIAIQSQANGTAAITTTISDYPRYSTALNSSQTSELRAVATAVVGALLTGAEVSVSIYGHADFDAKGREFEIKVSTERAQAATASLTTLLKEEAAKVQLSDSRLQSIQYIVMGIGTSRPVYYKPANEEERKANRRVDFVWNVGSPPPAMPESVFDRCNRVLTGATPSGPVRRMTCACTKFLQQSPRVQDSHYDFRSHSSIPGSAGMPKLTPEQWDAAIKMLVRHMRQDIFKSSDGFSDSEFVNNLLNLDDTVGQNHQ